MKLLVKVVGATNDGFSNLNRVAPSTVADVWNIVEIQREKAIWKIKESINHSNREPYIDIFLHSVLRAATDRNQFCPKWSL